MAKMSRAYKSEMPLFIRACCDYYNCQRRQYTHYDTLRISPNATQKEIRNAYIKLSKEMHPDCGKKGNHADFVKINEAYKVLSNRGDRQYYDAISKYHNVYTTSSHQYHGFDNTFDQWKRYNMACSRNQTKFSEKDRITATLYCLLLMIVGAVIQILHIKALTNYTKQAAIDRNRKLHSQNQRIRDLYKNKTLEKKFSEFMDLRKEHGLPTIDK